jgi:hypothetical protein
MVSFHILLLLLLIIILHILHILQHITLSLHPAPRSLPTGLVSAACLSRALRLQRLLAVLRRAVGVVEGKEGSYSWWWLRVLRYEYDVICQCMPVACDGCQVTLGAPSHRLCYRFYVVFLILAAGEKRRRRPPLRSWGRTHADSGSGGPRHCIQVMMRAMHLVAISALTRSQ